MDKALSVTEFTRAFKAMAERQFGDVRVEGELSYFTPHRSGHWYFAIKDEGAILNCVMFRGNNQSMRWTPNVGDRVIVGGGSRDRKLLVPPASLAALHDAEVVDALATPV